MEIGQIDGISRRNREIGEIDGIHGGGREKLQERIGRKRGNLASLHLLLLLSPAPLSPSPSRAAAPLLLPLAPLCSTLSSHPLCSYLSRRPCHMHFCIFLCCCSPRCHALLCCCSPLFLFSLWLSETSFWEFRHWLICCP